MIDLGRLATQHTTASIGLYAAQGNFHPQVVVHGRRWDAIATTSVGHPRDTIPMVAGWLSVITDPIVVVTIIEGFMKASVDPTVGTGRTLAQQADTDPTIRTVLLVALYDCAALSRTHESMALLELDQEGQPDWQVTQMTAGEGVLPTRVRDSIRRGVLFGATSDTPGSIAEEEGAMRAAMPGVTVALMPSGTLGTVRDES